jgi:hypothetical protein
VKFSDVAVDGHTLSAYGAHQFIATGDKASVSGIGQTAHFTVTFKHS